MIFDKSFAFLQTELGVKRVLHEDRTERKRMSQKIVDKAWSEKLFKASDGI